MKSKIVYNINPNLKQYPTEKLKLARQFTQKIYNEFGRFISAVILFGSTARNAQKSHDIDILIILDDVRVEFTRDLVETYRIITEKAIADVDPKLLHIQSLTLTSFWEYVRAGDPVAVNILRDGIALIDTGFFDPLQLLLKEGRIRPTEESIYNYFTMAPAALFRSKQNMLNAVIELYWGVIDAAHAALMTQGEVPPSPIHIAEVFDRRMVKTRIIEKKHEETLQLMYALFKKIVNREIKEISGKDYDKYKVMSEDFVNRIKKYIDTR